AVLADASAESTMTIAAVVDEEATPVSAPPPNRSSSSAGGGEDDLPPAAVVPPAGHDGAPPATAVDGNQASSVSDIESGRVAAAAPASSSSVPATFAPAEAAAGGGTRPSGGVVAPSSSPTAAGAASSSLLSSAAVLALAGPENYEEFPQPFSCLNVPVRPYERSTSRSSFGGGGGGGGGSSSGFGDTEAGGGLERQDDGGFMSNGGGQEGEECGGGREEGWVRPEIDVADLVMDNNEFYTPHGKGGGDGDYNNNNNNHNCGFDDDSSTYSSHTISNNKALRDAVVIVAVASAEMRALQRKGSSVGGGGGSNRSDSCRRLRFDTAADEGSVARGGFTPAADVDGNDHPSFPRKEGRLEAAAKAGVAAAAAGAKSSTGLSAALFRDETSPLPPGGGVNTPGKDSAGVWRPSAGRNPANFRDNRNPYSRENDRAVGASAASAGAAPVSSTPVPPTPRSLPGLLSMSFDNGMMVEEGLRQSQPRLSPPTVLERSQERRASEQHKAWQQQEQQRLRRRRSSSVGSSAVSTITSGSSSGSHDFDEYVYDGGASDGRVGRHQQRIAAGAARGAGDCTLRPFLSYASIMTSCGAGSSGEFAPGDSPTLPPGLNGNRDDADTAPPTAGANNGGGGGAGAATGKDEAETTPQLQQTDNFDTGRLTDTVGWEGSPKSRGGVSDGVSGNKARGVVDRANFDTAPFFVCGDKAPRGGAGARGGVGMTGVPTGLFDSTKKWFDSVSKGVVEGGDQREVVGMVDNDSNAQLGSPIEGTE
ncbi:unnamed protein product, partial [Ectocarpus fasciculatus]